MLRRRASAAGLLGLLAVYTVGDRDSGLVTQAIATGILLGGVYALVSVGLTLIFGVLGIVNFAQGSMLTLAMYIVYSLGQAPRDAGVRRHPAGGADHVRPSATSSS